MGLEAKEIFKIVLNVSKKTKIPAYVVGGYVRDFLLEKENKKDVDFVVAGSGITFARELDATLKQEGSLIVFEDFDTARYVLGEGENQVVLEFAGARQELYAPHSRKPVVSEASIEQDLMRRDFTVNALAVLVDNCVIRGKLVPTATFKKHIIDPFGGLADLKEKILKTPLDPDVTFSDDPLRMLRAVRFAAQLNFAIHPKTFESIHTNRERIKIVSAERVQEELLKLLATNQPSVGLFFMFQCHLMDIILPEVSRLNGVEDVFGHQHKDNLVHSFKVVDNIANESPKVWLRLAGLLHDIGKPATKKFVPKIGWTFHAHEHMGRKMVYALARRLKFSKDLTDYLAKLVRWHLQPIALMDDGITDSAVRRLVVTMGAELDDLLILGRGDITTGNPYKKEKRLKNYDLLRAKIAELIERDKLNSFQSPVRGDEIMAVCKLKPGPTVGKIKTAIEEAILDGKIPNDHEQAYAFFLNIKDSFCSVAADWERV